MWASSSSGEPFLISGDEDQLDEDRNQWLLSFFVTDEDENTNETNEKTEVDTIDAHASLSSLSPSLSLSVSFSPKRFVSWNSQQQVFGSLTLINFSVIVTWREIDRGRERKTEGEKRKAIPLVTHFFH